MSDAGNSIRAGHRRIREALADRVKHALERGTRDDLNALVTLLEGELLQHARAEQEHFYPAVDELVRDHGRATATMDIDHEAIAKLVHTIAASAERLRVTRDRMPRMEARAALRDALVRLDTLLGVHLEKEERVYVPLLEAHLGAEEQAALVRRMHPADGEHDEPAGGPPGRG